MTNVVHLIDNMEFMAGLPDNAFDLAIVDPPYGIGENWKKDKNSKFYKHKLTYKNKSIPSKKYFTEIRRISKNQIIWGGNYYTEFLPPRNSWIAWDKNKDYLTQHGAEGELAWTSFNIPLRIIKLNWNGFVRCENRYGKHPHEKPIALYKWLLANYAKPGQTIFDSHVGSGSIRIACHDMGFYFVGCEIDPEYWQAQENRYRDYLKKGKELFTPEEYQERIYDSQSER